MADLPNVDEKTTTTPPVETNTEEQGASESVSPDGRTEGEVFSETEEVERSNRYRKLANDKKALAIENARLKQNLGVYQSLLTQQAQADLVKTRNVPTPYPEQEVETAFRTLKDRGMMTREEGEAMFNEIQTRINWDFKHRDNERDINRKSSHLPHYDRDEVEEYAREHGLSDPLAAYRDMYFDEITDALKKTSPKSSSVGSMRPSKPTDSSKEGMTIESLKQKLAGPDGRAYYEKLTRDDPHALDTLIQSLSE